MSQVARGDDVHVYRGRRIHRARSDVGMLTFCWRRWDAVVVGPPASERPRCRDCETAFQKEDGDA